MPLLQVLKKLYSKPFHNTLNYASAANIEEVMKFYNLGDKTFETDFNFEIILKSSSFLTKPDLLNVMKKNICCISGKQLNSKN